jgi:hypothetical protein
MDVNGRAIFAGAHVIILKNFHDAIHVGNGRRDSDG